MTSPVSRGFHGRRRPVTALAAAGISPPRSAAQASC